jgi:hypothetical protein
VPKLYKENRIAVERTLDEGEADRMLHKDYGRKGSFKKISSREPRGAWRQDKSMGGKLSVVNNLTLALSQLQWRVELEQWVSCETVANR